MTELNAGSESRFEDIVEKYSILEPRFAQQTVRRGNGQEQEVFKFSPDLGVWQRDQDTAVGEAVIVCGGVIMYDRMLESVAETGDSYQFRSFFKQLRKTLNSGDLTVASLGCVVADMYPPVSTMGHSLSGRGHYHNAQKEYLDGIRFAGFDVLAAANPYNLDAGLRGLLATEKNILAQDMVPSGIGQEKIPLFDVNGIRIALLSYTMESNLTDTITAEGQNEFLNIFSPEKATADISEAHAKGAQFILAYIDGRSDDRKYGRPQRESAARELAEAGANYVICNHPFIVTRYSKFETSDGRIVPISTGLGTLMAGVSKTYAQQSAILRVKVRLTSTGGIEVEDSYIPTHRKSLERGGMLPVVVAHDFFGDKVLNADFTTEVQQTVAKQMGPRIFIDDSRHMSMNTHGNAHFTPLEIAELLQVRFTEDDVVRLGESANTPLRVVALPKQAEADTCAVITAYKRGRNSATNFRGLTVEECKQNRPAMIIAEKPIEGIPTLVVEDSWKAYMKIVDTLLTQFSPFTVAITGTAGKTTTKDMLGEVFPQHLRTLHVAGNLNTQITAASNINKLTISDQAYIQEVHGATPGSSSALSKMLKPHVAIITSIGEGHLEQMGSIENIVTGKMQIADGLRKDGVLILNNDNEYLRNVTPDVATIRYGIDDPSMDYWARNVRRVEDVQKFEIVEPDGLSHDVSLSVLGLHNVSNALATFAAARQAGIPAHKIVAGLSRFRSSATRQNIIETGGYKIFLDAFNSNVLSMTLALETLCSITPDTSTGRHIVVMGDMGEQGDKFVENHALIGETIADMDIDVLFSIGEGTAYTAKTAADRGIDARHFNDFDSLIRAISTDICPGDVILFKAAGGVDLPKNVVYPLFGRIV